MNPNPSAPENNRHHAGGYRSQTEVEDMLLGRGPGDPDWYGYPGQEDTSNEPEQSDTGTGKTLDREGQTNRVPF